MAHADKLGWLISLRDQDIIPPRFWISFIDCLIQCFLTKIVGSNIFEMHCHTIWVGWLQAKITAYWKKAEKLIYTKINHLKHPCPYSDTRTKARKKLTPGLSTKQFLTNLLEFPVNHDVKLKLLMLQDIKPGISSFSHAVFRLKTLSCEDVFHVSNNTQVHT